MPASERTGGCLVAAAAGLALRSLSVSGPLAVAAKKFIDVVTGLLAEWSGRSEEILRPDVAMEASNLVASVIDADANHTDDELWAYVDSFGHEIPVPIAGRTPAELRQAKIVAARRRWVERPSVLFETLAELDGKDGGRRSHRYYELAMKLAHTTASLDLLPSPTELLLIEQLRGALLTSMDRNLVPRPGTPGANAPAPVKAIPTTPGATAAGDPTGPTKPDEPDGPARPLDELLAELEDLVGLVPVKKEVRLLTSLLQVQKLRVERNLPVIETSQHLVFTGNPGTGKTTVARLLAQIYRSLGVVTRGQLVETDRSALVAGYVGQTALKTREVAERALGGVLLIDEAYALVRGGDNDFGIEAIDTLVKIMEDHRANLALIAAGYTEEMHAFIESNPGLRSRFNRTVQFPDYTNDELQRIFVKLGETHRYRPTPGALDVFKKILAKQPRDKGFGNARFVRNMFERAISNQAQRLVNVPAATDEMLSTLEAADITL